MKSATRSANPPFDASEEMQLAFPTGGLAKRAFDLTAAAAALLIFSPLFLLVMALVKLSDPGPAFYGHRRVGHNGRYFKCLKFRTMMVNGDEVLRRHLQNNPEAAEEWRTTRKLKNDPRVTAVGAVLRKLSLDELPQLLNVVMGDMSLVGPRPIVRSEVNKYGQVFEEYCMVKPGITGLWQVSGRNNTTYQERVNFDQYYISNWSVWMDLWILIKTVPVVIFGYGAY